MDKPKVEQNELDRAQILNNILSISTEYMSKIERYVRDVTIAVGETDKARELFEKKEKELRSSFWEKLIVTIIPFLAIIAFLIGLSFLPCGTKWSGFGVQFSNAECVKQ